MANFERSGWRDQWLSSRHRIWGPGICASDIDWMPYAEYTDGGQPVAVCDYKHKAATEPLAHASRVSIGAMANLWTMRGSFMKKLAYWTVRYWPDHDGAVEVLAMNDSASADAIAMGWRGLHRGHSVPPVATWISLTEFQWVGYQYRARGYFHAIPAKLGQEMPPWNELMGSRS